MSKIKRALVSVSDKDGILDLCRFLTEQGVEIISTGGTAKLLSENDVPIVNISDYTGFPEMMDGRVKTLHPKVHGGLLALRDNEEHLKAMEDNDISSIDLVVVNLYPFEAVYSKEESSFEEVIENIDIGGPSMLRSAAKNFPFVGVVTEPAQYAQVKEEMGRFDGGLSPEFKKSLALKVFEKTSRYDSLIATFLKEGEAGKKTFPQGFSLNLEKEASLRYGENPHQQAAFYSLPDVTEPVRLQDAEILQGKALSFNNYLDFDGALSCVRDFDTGACVIVKHTNPCGVALAEDPCEAFKKAWAADDVSAFGSVIAFNRKVDEATALAIGQYFVEGVIAPDFSEEALAAFQKKKNLRVMKLSIHENLKETGYFDIKRVAGGLLVQDRDGMTEDVASFKVVTEKKPTDKEMEDLLFAWKVVKNVKSNAIVYVKDGVTVGVGAGQMSRVDSSRFGSLKAKDGVEGTLLASDAFFPFRDGVDVAAEQGVKAIIQPGGSIRDEEVIQACNEHGIAMIFTGFRHFRH